MGERLDALLQSIYYDESNPASFGGVKSLWHASKKINPAVRKQDVEEWLSGQDAYTLHKEAKQKYIRRKTVVGGRGQQLQADLVDIHQHAKSNSDFTFLLTVIDCFSREAWVYPIKNKTGECVSEALEKVLRDRKFFSFQTDKGKEFYNTSVQMMLKRYGVKHFSSENETIKASLVERFNKTLRARLHRSMTARGNERILGVLPKIVDAYNNSYNDSIGMSPAEVFRANQEDIHQRLEFDLKSAMVKLPDAVPLKAGDVVRITKARGAFERGFTPNWTREIFRVVGIDNYQRPTAYRIKDLSGEEVQGIFYRKELQKVKEPDTYAVERVLSTRKRGRNTQYLVKWLGYPESFNSWVNASDMNI